VALTISDMDPHGITRNICLKSPPNTMTFSPKTESSFVIPFIMSFRVLSRASKQNLCVIGASSQIISFSFFNNSDALDHCEMLHIECSSVGTGILNLECAVLPPGNSREAIPLEATVSTILPSERTAAESVFHMNVLPVPPYLYKKNTPPCLLTTACLIFSKIFFCSPVIEWLFKLIAYCNSI